MKKLRQIIFQLQIGSCLQRSYATRPPRPEPVPLNKCLLVSKVTRYELEQNRHQGASPTQLEKLIRRRGSDYEALFHYHKLQKDFERTVQAVLEQHGAEVKLVNRLSYNQQVIDWCDVVIPCGGDGTFLLAASRVRDSKKPVIGFNSDPSRSEGRLCLPKWCSRDLNAALKTIKDRKFKWLQRSRIRTTLASDERLKSDKDEGPVDLHKPILARYNVGADGESRTNPSVAYGLDQELEMEGEEYNRRRKKEEDELLDRNNQPQMFKRVLPFLALNEVFIGENVSARVSHLQINVEGAHRATRTKSSGLCVSTGTGSTSWHLSINTLRQQSVEELMKMWCEGFCPAPTEDQLNILTHKYNNTLIFPPDDPRFSYSVRELITAEMWPSPKDFKSRDFARTLHVKSRCVDAGLVIDGGVSFPFNDGTEATLEMHPEDCLTTISIEKY